MKINYNELDAVQKINDWYRSKSNHKTFNYDDPFLKLQNWLYTRPSDFEHRVKSVMSKIDRFKSWPKELINKQYDRWNECNRPKALLEVLFSYCSENEKGNDHRKKENIQKNRDIFFEHFPNFQELRHITSLCRSLLNNYTENYLEGEWEEVA